MGEAKKRQISKKNFLLQPENRFCCYCGASADSVDHFPPRNVFTKRMFPEGYMFPACKSCNLGKSHDEQSLSLLICLMDWRIDEHDEDFSRHVKAVRNNNPKLINEMRSLSSVETKRHLRFQFGNSENTNRRRLVGWKGIEIGPEGKRLLDLMCIWFAQTMYFKHNQEIFRGQVIFTDIPFGLLREKQFWDMAKKLSSSAEIVHTGHNISKQFFYRYFSVKGGFFSIFQFRDPQTLFFVCALAEENIVDNLDIPEGWKNSGLIGPKK